MNKLMQKANRIPSIKHVGVLYLISMVLFVGAGELVQHIKPISLSYEKQMLVIVLTQLIFVFLPTFIYILTKKINIKKTLKFNKISLKNIIISVFVMIFAMPIASLLNSIVIIILAYFGKTHPPAIFPTENVYQLIISISVIALVPAIFEEILFRGMVFKSLERFGYKKAMLISAILFALLHRDIQNLLGTFILGIVLAYIVYRTNSIFASMAAHFTNNALIIVFMYLTRNINNSVQQYDKNIFSQFANIDVIMVVISIFIFISILMVATGIFVGLIILLRYTTKDIQRDNYQSNISKLNIYTSIPIIISIILVLYTFIKQLT